MLKSYLLLTLAIIFEVVGTLLLPLSNNFTKLIPTIGLTIFYISSFYFLTFALKLIPISIVYATWSGMGIFLITTFGYFIYHQTVKWQVVIGLLLIIVGVALDTLQQLESHLMMRHYDGFLTKGKIRGRRRV